MSLPNDPATYEVYARKQLAAEIHPFFAKPKETLQNGGFIVYDNKFLFLLGPNPTIEVIASNHDYPFAHEAGVYIPSTGEIFITSNHIRKNGSKKIQISKVKKSASNNSYEVTEIEPEVVLANGAVNYKNDVLFCEQGSLTTPGGLKIMKTSPPYDIKPILTNYHGRWFNSVNDVVIHSDGSIWFTDPDYGFEQDIRPRPQLPNQIYRFDPESGDIRAMADGLGMPNGLCFSPDEQTLYITDTDGVHGEGVYKPSKPASIYAYSVQNFSSSPFLTNKRLFAMADNGVPDGIKCDLVGNIYSGCGDGVHVWSAGGSLIGKIWLPTGGCANFCFGKDGEIFILNENRIWRAQLDGGVKGALLGI